MIKRKTLEQIELMRVAGSIVRRAHEAAFARVAPGTTTAEIDAAVDEAIAASGGEPLFKGHRVKGTFPFPAAACVSVNEEVIHGIPGPRTLRAGDIVSVDVGARYRGWCADAAVTWPVGEIAPDLRRLLDTTEGALRVAIERIRPGLAWSQIARDMEAHVQRAGLHVIDQLCGHGIGQRMWEPPHVLNHYSRREDFELAPGMVLAIEPMVAVGTRDVVGMPDGWTFETADGSAAAHFEHTVAVTEQGPVVLTAAADGTGWAR